VTAHYITKEEEHVSVLLNIIELSEAVYNRAYLCKKLLKVTNRLGITYAILSVTRDNAAPNNTMLAEFEAIIAERYKVIDERDKAYFCYKFNKVKGDVRCYAHIYNIAVQVGQLLYASY
jgi:hypothetical protein